jgi:TATA-box binding protein (TBP) (component of TFIID and TFIIIB)
MTSEIKRTGNDLVFPAFDDIKVSTKTFTVKTNITLDISRVAEILPITDYVVVPKRRGRKKKGIVIDPNKDVGYGSIITVDHMRNIRGVDTKPKKKKKKKVTKWFRNSFTVVIKLDKLINFKVYRNGTFQMTGCKTHEHAEMCVKYTWDFIKNDKSLYSYEWGTCLEALFIPAMRNIDFSLGFLVDREKLDLYMATQTEFHCLLETSFGYTGVNIRIPLEVPITDMKIKKIKLDNLDQEWTEAKVVDYQEYLDLLPAKEQNAKLKYDRHNTFLVFHSGKCIMSGTCKPLMKPVYNEFLRVMRKCYDKVEERLDI